MRRFLVVVAVAAAGCSSHVASTSDVDPTKATTPTVAVAAQATDYVAIVKAKRSMVLAARFTGRVERVHVRPSQMVHAGDVLVVQDTHELRYQLEQSLDEQASARASADRSTLQAGAAQTKLHVTELLVRNGAAPVIQFNQAASDVAIANATARADRKTADARAAATASIEDKIDHAEITAPFDGVISMVHVNDGDAVTAGATIVRILDPSELMVTFAVPSTDETPLENGMRVQLQLPHHAPISAVIIGISDDVEPPISYRLVDADIDAGTVRPGELKLSAVGRVTVASRGGL